jgi:hypothetical protein
MGLGSKIQKKLVLDPRSQIQGSKRHRIRNTVLYALRKNHSDYPNEIVNIFHLEKNRNFLTFVLF